MTDLSKTKSHLKQVSFKIYLDTNNLYGSGMGEYLPYERFYSKKYQSGNLTNNQQKCIDCLKPRSNKNKRESKKCDYFYGPSY